jgi:hypothetical protein
VINEKEKIPLDGDLKDDAPVDLSSNKKKDKKKKCIKKVIYYDSDTSSSQKDDNDSSSSKKNVVQQNYTRTSFNYSHILYNSNVHLVSIPLGKPPHFYGEDYSWWSHKMHSHLFSLHPSIWDIVENGMHMLDSDDEKYNAIYV